jgi:hypothetical protein
VPNSTGQEVPIDAEFMADFDETYKQIAKQGERVLGFAKLRLDLVSLRPRHV